MNGEASVLEGIFDRFCKRGIRYAVMRNYELLPDSTGGSDLDLLVAPQDREITRLAILDAVTAAGGACIGITSTAGFFKVCAFGVAAGQPNSWWGLCVDVNAGLFYKGQRLISDDFLLLAHSHNGITVLNEGLASVLAILKEVLNNGVWPQRYAVLGRVGVKSDWTGISELLTPLGGGALALLRKLIMESAEVLPNLQTLRRLRQLISAAGARSRPLAWAFGRFRYHYSKLLRYAAPQGKVIVLMGADGAGKTTIIRELRNVLDQATHNAVSVQHLRPGCLPPLSRFKGESREPLQAVSNPHGSDPSGAIGSLVRIAYLTFDYVIGYWLKVRPRIAKQPTIWIFDRYAYDILLDPRRFRIDLPSCVISAFVKLAPRPDLVFCLYGDPEVLAQRKGELSIAEVRRQVNLIKTLFAGISGTWLVRSDIPLEETRSAILQSLLAECRQKIN